MQLGSKVTLGRLQGGTVFVVPVDSTWCLVAERNASHPSGSYGPVFLIERKKVDESQRTAAPPADRPQ